MIRGSAVLLALLVGIGAATRSPSTPVAKNPGSTMRSPDAVSTESGRNDPRRTLRGFPVSAPPIVFVSRVPDPDRRLIPGLGPLGRTFSRGGRLLLRTASGSVQPFLRDDRFFDVADPAVSWDGKRVAFAGRVHRDSAWRIWMADAAGRGVAPVTRTDRRLDLTRYGAAAARFARYDDFDPTWLTDGSICFASTRYPQVSGRPDVLASNLFAIEADGSGMRRMTSDRHGAEEPTVDPRTGLIVYARWWSNRWLASERDSHGITLDRGRAVPADEVDLWHAIQIDPDGDRGKLAGGNPRVRAETMAYQPLVLDDGTLVGVRSDPLSLVPDASRRAATWIQAFPGGFGPARWVPGVRASRGAEPEPIPACAPASLSGRRVAISADPGGRGDFGLYLAEVAPRDPDDDAEWKSPASSPTALVLLVDLPGTDELDAAMLAPRRRPPVVHHYADALPRDVPLGALEEYRRHTQTFRFDCMNVFANAPVDAPIPDAPPFEPDLEIRFYAGLARPAVAGGDSVTLLRQAAVQLTGGVHEEGMPSDAPMFEQLVAAHGRVVRSETGPAHVSGFNVARFAAGTKCMGCHLGHSVIPVAQDYVNAKRFNVSPSARVTASSTAPGTAGPRGAVDRRAKGPAEKVAWIAESVADEWIRLEWPAPVEVDTVILYPLRVLELHGTDLKLREVELAFSEGGKSSGRLRVRTELSPVETRVACGGVRADVLELRPMRASGRVLGRSRVGLAEIETRARIAETLNP